MYYIVLFSDIRKTLLIKFYQYRGDYDSNNPVVDTSFNDFKIIFLDIFILIF